MLALCSSAYFPRIVLLLADRLLRVVLLRVTDQFLRSLLRRRQRDNDEDLTTSDEATTGVCTAHLRRMSGSIHCPRTRDEGDVVF